MRDGHHLQSGGSDPIISGHLMSGPSQAQDRPRGPVSYQASPEISCAYRDGGTIQIFRRTQKK